MNYVLAALIVGASLTTPTQTGLATYYNPGIFEQVIVNRASWGQVFSCDECLGYAAMLYPADIGKRICVNGYGPLLVVDSAAAHHRDVLIAQGWIVDLEKATFAKLELPNRPVAVSLKEC